MTRANPSRILFIAVPGLGDTLLSTPLLASLSQTYPKAEIHYAVREGRESIVENMPCVAQIISLERRPRLFHSLQFLRSIWRKYDLVVSTSASDRTVMIALCGARTRVSVVPPFSFKSCWKHLALTARVISDPDKNIVEQNLELADCLGIERCSSVLVPHTVEAKAFLDRKLPFDRKATRYVVVHMIPRFEYKCWPEQYWCELLTHLIDLGYQVVMTSGPARDDIGRVRALVEKFSTGVVDMAGLLSFDQVGQLITDAVCYFGTDTVTTHLAAATGTATVALFGPTNVNKWAPWPCDYSDREPPFVRSVRIQQKDNVLLLSGTCECIPIKDSCLQRSDGRSACLLGLTPEVVIPTVDDFLFQQRSSSRATGPRHQ